MWSRTSKSRSTRRSARRRGKSGKKRIPVARLVMVLSLLGFLLFTMGAVGYVIFFRTVLA